MSSRGQPTRGGPPAWGLGEVLTNPLCKKNSVKKHSHAGFVLLNQNCAGDKIEKNEMGWACGACG